MKRLSLLLTGLMLLGTPAYALKRGDKMPDTSMSEPIIASEWYDEGRSGIAVLRKLDTDQLKYLEIYTRCNEDKPFIIYDIEHKIRFVDNPTDGIIDEIIHNPCGDFYDYAPDCEELK